DAQSHPNFAYRPETGEEPFHSLMGVPIVRGGRVTGILVVQNQQRRVYEEEEIETLETVAMVLAELVSGGELIPVQEILPVDGNALLPLRIEGTRLNPGIGIGIAVLHEPRIIIRKLVADDPEFETQRLKEALASMRSALEELFTAPDLGSDGEHMDILETYRMFAEDAGWIARMGEAIRTGLTAEAAVQKVHEDTRLRMSQVSDPYLRERLHDLDDLANRLLQHLAGGHGTAASSDLPDDAVVVCRTMGPTELLDYDRRKLRALVMEEGSATMHIIIVARALDIPVVGRTKDILGKVEPGDPMIVDGDTGQVLLRPAEEIRDLFAESIRQRAQRAATYAAMRD
ncbi:MAG: GAF domain-containing protein, partial [Rhodospirillales bacterium]|nr:GAF domain-containing protein [Rhodospirillales bacterium]